MIKLTAFGDVMLGTCSITASSNKETIPQRIRESKIDVSCFLDLTDESHINVINLETPVSYDTEKSRGKKHLIGPAEGVDILKSIGINLATLANNHVFDYGFDIVNETKKLLKDRGIDYVHSPQFGDVSITKFVSGKKITFIGYGAKPYYNFETDHLDPDYYKNYSYFLKEIRNFSSDTDFDCLSTGNILPLLKEVENNRDSDYIVLLLHWGFANTRFPSPLQIEIAHKLIDLGVDVIIGNHPHVIQPVEFYRDGVIAYSLGNFIFDSWKPDKIKSLVLSLTFAERISAEFYICERNNDFCYSSTKVVMKEKKMLVNNNDVIFSYPSFMTEEMKNVEGILSSYYKYTKYRNEKRSPNVMNEFKELLKSNLSFKQKLSILRDKVLR